MALAIFTWDMPSGERIHVYEEKAHKEWIQSVLQQPGVTEVRAYRNPHHTTPQVMIHIEFTSLDAWHQFYTSERYGELMFDLRAAGCGLFADHGAGMGRVAAAAGTRAVSYRLSQAPTRGRDGLAPSQGRCRAGP